MRHITPLHITAASQMQKISAASFFIGTVKQGTTHG
jgi:hypothetical protein